MGCFVFIIVQYTKNAVVFRNQQMYNWVKLPFSCSASVLCIGKVMLKIQQKKELYDTAPFFIRLVSESDSEGIEKWDGFFCFFFCHYLFGFASLFYLTVGLVLNMDVFALVTVKCKLGE